MEPGGNVCKKCKRGNSAENNEIVFCDQCGTPYHQLCHNPPIDQIVVDIRDARWFCHVCSQSQSVLPLETGLSGEGLENEVRMAYLSSLSKSQLIQLLRYAEKLHPTLPIYSPNTLQHYEQLKRQKAGTNPPARRNYEDVLAQVVSSSERGLELAEIWTALEAKEGKIDSSVKHSVSRALQRVLRKGRIFKLGDRYHREYPDAAAAGR